MNRSFSLKCWGASMALLLGLICIGVSADEVVPEPSQRPLFHAQENVVHLVKIGDQGALRDLVLELRKYSCLPVDLNVVKYENSDMATLTGTEEETAKWSALLGGLVQPEEQEEEEMVTQVLRLKHAKPQEVFSSMQNLFNSSGVTAAPAPGDESIILTGPADKLEMLIAMIDQLEEASLAAQEDESAMPRNIEVTVSLILALRQGVNEDLQEVAGLEDVTAELKNSLGFTSFYGVDSNFFRTREGEELESSWMFSAQALGISEEQQAMAGGCNAKIQMMPKCNYGKGAYTISVDDFRMGIEVPYITGGSTEPDGRIRTTRVSRQDYGLRTNLDVREGQKVVLGRLGISANSNEAYFVILSAKVVE
jgi:hypothetical protein